VPPCFIAFTPNLRAQTNTYTSVSSSGIWTGVGGYRYIEVTGLITTVGTGLLPVITLPVAYTNVLNTIVGKESVITGNMLQVTLKAGNVAGINLYNAGDPSASGATIQLSGTYR